MRWLSKTPSHLDDVARTHTEVTSTQGNTEVDTYERATSDYMSPSSPSPPPVFRGPLPQELDCEFPILYSIYYNTILTFPAKYSEYRA